MQGKKGGFFLLARKCLRGFIPGFFHAGRSLSWINIYTYIYLELVTFGQALREQRLSTLGPGVVIRKRAGEGRENWRAELKSQKENFLKEVDLALSASRSWKVRERYGERNGWRKQDYRKLRSQNIETIVS